jgi:hypothetical protein
MVYPMCMTSVRYKYYFSVEALCVADTEPHLQNLFTFSSYVDIYA